MQRRFGTQSEKQSPINRVKNFISNISTRITKKQDNPLLNSSLSGLFLAGIVIVGYGVGKQT